MNEFLKVTNWNKTKTKDPDPKVVIIDLGQDSSRVMDELKKATGGSDAVRTVGTDNPE
jgi:hypothetical protein